MTLADPEDVKKVFTADHAVLGVGCQLDPRNGRRPDPVMGAEVAFVPAVCADRSSVYFAASSVLTAGATPGATNVYRYDTQTATTDYVATVLYRQRLTPLVKRGHCLNTANAPVGSFQPCPRR